MSESKESIEERIKAAASAVDRVLSEHACTLVAVPTWKPDGRGGWFLATHVQVVCK